ncbi:MAG: glycerate kinase [Betaproteobacteria bacterium HGW-Betaproteobacteria-16]|nr:MAG: glycerate kinase [Betaproteobacteria bacterium HGW-Betaproteobacteria-16]
MPDWMAKLRPFLFPALAVAIAYAAWQSYGAKGLLLALLMISFWVLLHFTKLMRLLRAAAKRPMGHVRNAKVLHGSLKKGMPLVEVVRRTQSLGLRHSDPEHDPEVLEWGDENGDAVICTFLRGRLQTFELRLAEPARAGSSTVAAEPERPRT